MNKRKKDISMYFVRQEVGEKLFYLMLSCGPWIVKFSFGSNQKHFVVSRTSKLCYSVLSNGSLQQDIACVFISLLFFNKNINKWDSSLLLV